jgi:C-terminal processing protease CtpA/Prc
MQQAFEEFWRSFGAGFYDPTMHGVNWKALRTKYASLLPGITTPEEFTALLSNMVGEVNSSHSEVFAASSVPPGPSQPTLAMVYDNDYSGPGLRVTAVMPGSPADTAGSKILAGEYILAIDGEDVKNDENYYRTIQNKQGKDVEILVNSSPNREGARTVKLKPITSAAYDDLDYAARVKHTRELVAKLSGGKLAYIHIKEMMAPSLAKFNRELWSDAYLKDGLVLDIRGNAGGNTHDAILQALSHKVYGYIRARDGDAETQPVKAWDKPIVLLINEDSFSDAEVFPQGFRALHLGKIVGVPTPGYVIGTIDASLLDGTHYRIPTVAYYTMDGRNMENLGIPPDIYVKNTPEDIIQHRDRQLETAVEVLLKANPDGVPTEVMPTFQSANDNPDGGSSSVHYKKGSGIRD